MNDYAHIVVSRIDSISLIIKKRNERTSILNRPCFGLSFCREGELCYSFKGREYISNSGCAIFLPAGQSYHIFCRTAGSFPLINFSCTSECVPDEFLTLPISNLELFDHDFSKMSETIKSMSDCQYRLLSIFYSIMNRLTKESLSLVNIPEILRPGINYMQSHLNDPALSNTDLAKCCHISEVYFRRLFSEVFGMSPKQYILTKRVERSADLLMDQSLSIAEIASLCGFVTLYNYYRVFRRQMNCTPNEYRKANLLD